MARNVPAKTRKWHEMCHFFYSSFASMYNLKMKFRRASRCALVLMYGFSFSYSMMSLSRKSAVRLFATYCTGRGNLFSPFLSWILCLGISQRTERSAIVSSFGMSFGLVIRGRCMLFSSLHEISKIRSAHLRTLSFDLCWWVKKGRLASFVFASHFVSHIQLVGGFPEPLSFKK